MKIDRDFIGFVFIVSMIVAFFVIVGLTQRKTELSQAPMPTTDTTEELEPDTYPVREDEIFRIVEAFAMVESGKNPDAKNGNCVGYLQISPVCVKEVNRLLGDEYFLLSDRYDMWASVAMFVAIMDHKNPTYDLKKACEIWNPTAGEWYYKRVLNAYKKLRDED